MSEAPDFESLLQTTADNIEEPLALPAGTYRWRISQKEFGETNQNQTPYVRFSCVPVEPVGEDVDMDDWEALHKQIEGDTTRRAQRLQFFITPNSLYRIKRFAANTLQMEVGGMTLNEIIEDCIGQEFQGTLRYVQARDNPERTFAEIEGLAPIE